MVSAAVPLPAAVPVTVSAAVPVTVSAVAAGGSVCSVVDMLTMTIKGISVSRRYLYLANGLCDWWSDWEWVEREQFGARASERHCLHRFFCEQVLFPLF